MKKVLIILLYNILLFNLIDVYAAEKVSIESITLNSKSDYAEIVKEASYDGLTISFEVKFHEINDYAKYDIVINNPTNIDYEISEDTGKNEYIKYKYEFQDNNNIVKKNSKKHLSITVLYDKEVPQELITDDNYIVAEKLMVYLKDEDNILNPNTLSNYLLLVLLLGILLVPIILYMYKKSLNKKLYIIIIVLIMIPISIYAAEKLSIEIDNKVYIKVSKTISNKLIEEHNEDFIKYQGLVTDEVGKTVQSTNVYFAKSQNNNNIIVGNYCWQIFRTTEQGGLKIIYNGPVVDGTCPTGRSITDRIIGKSKYNDKPYSIGSVGYMYNNRYEPKSDYNNYNVYFGNDIKYENGVYSLIDSKIGKDNNHHYTCDSTDETATCEIVKYVYNNYSSYYYELSGGLKINDIINDMLYAEDVNKNDSVMKSFIENWYENNFSEYTYLLDKNVYCNDRSLANYEESGWNPNGGDYNKNLWFRNNVLGADLSCPNITDQFSIGNNKAKLKYPIALIIEPERNAGGASLFKIDYWYWGMSPIFYRYDSLAYVSYVISGGDFNSGYFYNIDNVNSSDQNMINVRPVIALHKYVEIIDGNGTPQTPYIIKYD